MWQLRDLCHLICDCEETETGKNSLQLILHFMLRLWWGWYIRICRRETSYNRRTKRKSWEETWCYWSIAKQSRKCWKGCGETCRYWRIKTLWRKWWHPRARKRYCKLRKINLFISSLILLSCEARWRNKEVPRLLGWCRIMTQER